MTNTTRRRIKIKPVVRSTDKQRLNWLETINSPFDPTSPLRWVIDKMREKGGPRTIREAIDALRNID